MLKAHYEPDNSFFLFFSFLAFFQSKLQTLFSNQNLYKYSIELYIISGISRSTSNVKKKKKTVTRFEPTTLFMMARLFQKLPQILGRIIFQKFFCLLAPFPQIKAKAQSSFLLRRSFNILSSLSLF